MEAKDTGYCKTKREMQSCPNNLLQFRQQANISQDKLAEAVDCSRRTIGYIERGTHDPSVQMAYRIANYFKLYSMVGTKLKCLCYVFIKFHITSGLLKLPIEVHFQRKY